MSRMFAAPDSAPSESLRKASLQRALIATLALMVLTASLWLVEGRETAAPQAVPANASPATPSGPATDSAGIAAQAAPAGGSASTAVQQDPVVEPGRDANAAPQSGQQPAAPRGAEALPSGSAATDVTAEPPVPAEPARVDTPAAPDAALPVAAAEGAQASSRAAAPRLHSGPPPGPGYLIQLGVFLDTANAESMRRELERKGYPAHLQARVVLGPYPDRKSAIAAQEKVRRDRELDGMIVPPRK